MIEGQVVDGLFVRSRVLPIELPRVGQERNCVLKLGYDARVGGSTIYDKSGKGNNGAITGATWTRLPSGLWVLDFNGTTDFITVNDADSLSQVAGFTFSVWANMDDASSFKILHKGIYNTDGEYYWELDTDDAMYCYIFDESVASCFIGRGTAALTSSEGSWVHFALTYDGGITSASCKIYRNGVQIDNGNNEASPLSFVAMENLTGALEIGKRASIYANGKMILHKMRSRVLTATQLANEYNQERHLFNV